MSHLILASTSKYRAALLRRWRLSFDAIAPEVDEAPYKTQGLAPEKLVQTLSQAKAAAVSQRYPCATVIGSDQVLRHGDRIYGKAGSAENAVKQLMELKGQTQELLTGLCVISNGQTFYHLDRTIIQMREYSLNEAKHVVERDQSWDCAGSLKIEAGGTWLIESLGTSDPSAIEGLPLIALGKILRSLHSESALFGG